MQVNSLKFKISVLAMAILAAILITYSGFLFFSFRYALYQEMDQSLHVKARKTHNAVVSYLDTLGHNQRAFDFAINRIVAQKGDHPHKNKIEKLERLWLGQAQPLGLTRDYVEVLDESGKVVTRSANLARDVPLRLPKNVSAWRGRPIYKNLDLDKRRFRVVMEPIFYPKIQKRYVIVVVTSREHLIQLLNENLVVKTAAITLILIIAAFLSHLFAKSVLKPVQEITETARNIDYRDLSVRIKTEEVDVEMKVLVDSLNEMISRLEKSFRYIADFSANVSHELKTPLAIMRGESELALRADRSAEEYKRVIYNNLEEVTRMARLIEDLLLLTKLDYQPGTFRFANFNLIEFFEEITESSRILAAEKRITVETSIPEKPIFIEGDKVHLRRLFYNLINNAVKFTPPGGRIGIKLRVGKREAFVSVWDSGVGIPKEYLPRIFDKFFHFDGLNLESVSGLGLGLSIAVSIAKIHSGDIQVKSAPGEGTTFTVRLPLSKQASPSPVLVAG
ncbi:MAG: HAMP domain-containing protein [Candidatus Omnitrophica bacterium]|nr:HAMP domain-containing protein [Candidatus Omnitrophota bacterium]